MKSALFNFLFGPDPRVRRLLRYWGGTALLYVLWIAVLQVQVLAGKASAVDAGLLTIFGVTGMLCFFVLLRASGKVRVSPWLLSVSQAVFALACGIGNYVIAGPVRGASLMVLLVVMVFCTFSLRPRANLGLCASAIIGLGLAMAWMTVHAPQRFPLMEEVLHFTLATSALLAVTLLTGEMSKLRSNLKQQKQELLAAVSKIRTLATVDELTSLANRRYMNEVLSAEERRQGAPSGAMCIALLDIDFFKQVNDALGHDAGDAVLRTFAAAARAELRAADLLARWGGEEFLLLLPDTEVGVAGLVLQRMAERVRAIQIPDLTLGRELSFSAGLVQRAEGEPFAATIKRADHAMYMAKTAGRNRVVSA